MDKTPAGKWRKAIIAAGAGGVFGFLGAFGFMRLSGSGALGEIGNSGEIAALVGMIYLFTALAVGVGVASPQFGARFLNVEDADELEEQRRMLGLSGLSMAAIGGALVLLALAGPTGIVAGEVALSGTVVLIALAVWLSMKSRALVDELMATVSRETTAVGFYLLTLVGGGWSVLAHLQYVAGPTPLDWLSMFAGFLLLAAFGVCFSRGLMKPR